jgi:hypothetical protein
MLSRFPDWQERLARFFALHRNRPFRYGQWDCCLFAADALREITGVDIAADLRGRYTSRRAAYDLIRNTVQRPSVRAVAERAALLHGMPEVPITYARRGDMALIPRARDYSLGIVSLTGKEIVVLRARTLMTLPLSYGLLAWHA